MSESAEWTAYTEAFSDQFKHIAARDMAKALDEARATVAALTAERDAAYRRGWGAAIDAAAQSLRDAAEYSRSEWVRTSGGKDISSSYLHDANCQYAMSERIRAMQPPTAPTEHDAATLESNSYIRNLLSMSEGDRYNEICKMRDDKDYFLSVLGTESK